VRAHLGYLLAFGAPVCLITETDRELYDGNGEILRLEDALFGLSLVDAPQAWAWDLAPVGEIDRGFGVRNRVSGFADFRGPVPDA